MNDRDKSSIADSHPNSHVFPNIHETEKNGDSGSNISGSSFQPMFEGDNRKSSSSIRNPLAIPDQTKEDPLEKARRQGYSRGLAAGKETACKMVQGNLSPVIMELSEAIKEFEGFQVDLCDSSAHLSLKLALDIVEKITGVPSVIELKDLSEAGNQIRESIATAMAINLKMSPQDFKLITELASCGDSLTWENYHSVTISEDATVASGDINSEDAKLQWDLINKQVASTLDQIMSNQNNPTG